MLPANFPGRQNARRQRALARLGDTYAKSGASTFDEQRALLNRIRPDAVARAVRTKKDRSGTGRLARAQ